MSLRVVAPLPAGEVRRSSGMPPAAVDDGYMSRLVKLVPAEVIGPFPVLLESARYVPLPPGSARWTVYFVAWVLLLVVIVLRARATSGPGLSPQWGAVFVAAVAFVIWVHVMGGDFGFDYLYERFIATAQPDSVTRSPVPSQSPDDTKAVKAFVSNVSLLAWTTLAPVVYRGDEDPG